MPINVNGSVKASGAFGAIRACLSAGSKAQGVNINGLRPYRPYTLLVYTLLVYAATLAP